MYAGPGRRERRPDRAPAQRLLECPDGFIRSLRLHVECAEVLVSQWVVRPQFDGFEVAGDRRIKLALILEGDAQVVLGVGVAGIPVQGRAEVSDGLVGLLLLPERDAQVSEDRDGVRPQGQAGPAVGNRFIDVSQLPLLVRHHLVEPKVVGMHPQGPGEECHGFRRPQARRQRYQEVGRQLGQVRFAASCCKAGPSFRATASGPRAQGSGSASCAHASARREKASRAMYSQSSRAETSWDRTAEPRKAVCHFLGVLSDHQPPRANRLRRPDPRRQRRISHARTAHAACGSLQTVLPFPGRPRPAGIGGSSRRARLSPTG